ncbi:MAG: hypothetical protein R3E01_19825 [Pirellulaceae bacterium]
MKELNLSSVSFYNLLKREPNLLDDYDVVHVHSEYGTDADRRASFVCEGRLGGMIHRREIDRSKIVWDGYPYHLGLRGLWMGTPYEYDGERGVVERLKVRNG